MKILVVFTGGTIGSSVDSDGYFSPDQNKGYKLLNLYAEKYGDTEVSFETAMPIRILSEQLNSNYLYTIISFVKEKINEDYDGIIVTHGTDTVQYSASALGYALGNECIPVVLVSSNYILEDSRMNGLDNFKGAVDFICEKKYKGVFVSYRNPSKELTIHRATRLLAHNPYVDDLYSVYNSYVGTYLENGFVANESFFEMKDQMEVFANLWNGSFGSVIWLQSHPGMAWDKIDIENAQAILVSAYHSGTLNTDSRELISIAEQAQKLRVPIYLVGAVEEAVYSSKKTYDELGIKILPVMAPISAYMKLSMIISMGLDPDVYMNKSLAGDIWVQAN